MTALQSEVVNARTVASQAEQRATEAETRLAVARSEGVVDTRMLGKPNSFDETAENWRQFKFTRTRRSFRSETQVSYDREQR